ncbi:MAG TPA: hypothetical protein VLF59_06250 [Candidatus Saccharimonadales bacterium]|nr:hypothetical protein [Candidatus Saccharimonadales bacterium]
MQRSSISIVISTLTVVVLLALPAAASAHIFRTAGNIGVELHIEPDDQPIAGQPTHYRFTFEDVVGTFSLNQCICTVSFALAGRTIATRTVANQGSSVSENTFTFPDSGAYTITLAGKPTQAGTFPDFRMHYPARVGARHIHTLPVAAWLGIGAGVGAITLTAALMERSGRKRVAVQ